MQDMMRRVLYQLCEAIAFLHSRGVVYRDVKPENLLVDRHGNVKVSCSLLIPCTRVTVLASFFSAMQPHAEDELNSTLLSRLPQLCVAESSSYS